MALSLSIFLIAILFYSMGMRGLLGALKRDFIFPRDSSFGTIRYKGRKARLWGIIFFLVFTPVSVFFTGMLVDNIPQVNPVFLYATTILLGLGLVAFENRVWKKYSMGKQIR